MRRDRRVACGIALACVLGLLGGCGREPHDAIRLGIPTAPLSLDPRYATDAMSARIARLLYSPLVDFDAAAEPVPALASWQMPSSTLYRFRLRDAARFSDGRAITADDVVETYRAILDPALASPLHEALRNVVAVRAVDARSVEFQLAQPDRLFPGTLGIGVMAAGDARRPRDAWRLTSGPFTLEAQRDDGSLRLRRRSDGAAVEVVVVKDASVRALKLIAGELDIMQGNVPPEMVDWLTTRPGLRVVTHAGATFSYLGFNLSHGPLADQRVRAAISHAIDRAAIVHYLFRDRAQSAASLLPSTHWASAADLRVPAYDPAWSRRLLSAAGYADRPLRLHYKTSADAFRLRLATLLQSQLAEVGIDLQIDSLDWGTFYADVSAGRFEIFSLSWVGLKLPDIFRQAFHSRSLPPQGWNRGHYAEVEMDSLIEAAEVEADIARQRLLYHAIERRLLYDLPYVPLWFEQQTALLRADIEGFTLDADGSFDGLTTVRRVKTHEPR